MKTENPYKTPRSIKDSDENPPPLWLMQCVSAIVASIAICLVPVFGEVSEELEATVVLAVLVSFSVWLLFTCVVLWVNR